MENKTKLVNLKVDPADWELFKKITKMEGSNASVELRKFIKKYLSKREDI
jgi:hypothetical protein